MCTTDQGVRLRFDQVLDLDWLFLLLGMHGPFDTRREAGVARTECKQIAVEASARARTDELRLVELVAVPHLQG